MNHALQSLNRIRIATPLDVAHFTKTDADQFGKEGHPGFFLGISNDCESRKAAEQLLPLVYEELRNEFASLPLSLPRLANSFVAVRNTEVASEKKLSLRPGSKEAFIR